MRRKNFHNSYSIVNEPSIWDAVERWWINLNDGDFAEKTALPSNLPSKKNMVLITKNLTLFLSIFSSIFRNLAAQPVVLRDPNVPSHHCHQRLQEGLDSIAA
jgi:hypothetical protein